MKKICIFCLIAFLFLFLCACTKQKTNNDNEDALLNDGVMVLSVYVGDRTVPYYVYVNKKGKQIIDEYYTSASDFYKGYAIVKGENDSFNRLINKKGEYITPNEYDVIKLYQNEDVLIYSKRIKSEFDKHCFGIMKYDGTIITEAIYYAFNYITELKAFIVNGDDGCSLLDENGNDLLNQELYDQIIYSNGYIVCTNIFYNSKITITLYDKNYQKKAQFDFDNIARLSFGVVNENLFGAYDLFTYEGNMLDGYLLNLNGEKVSVPSGMKFNGIVNSDKVPFIALSKEDDPYLSGYYDANFNQKFYGKGTQFQYNYVLVREDDGYTSICDYDGKKLIDNVFKSIRDNTALNCIECSKENTIFYYSADTFELIYSYNTAEYHKLQYDKVKGEYYCSISGRDISRFGKIENGEFVQIDEELATSVINGYKIMISSNDGYLYVTKVGDSERIVSLTDGSYRCDYFDDGYFVITPRGRDGYIYVYDSNFKELFRFNIHRDK